MRAAHIHVAVEYTSPRLAPITGHMTHLLWKVPARYVSRALSPPRGRRRPSWMLDLLLGDPRVLDHLRPLRDLGANEFVEFLARGRRRRHAQVGQALLDLRYAQH